MFYINLNRDRRKFIIKMKKMFYKKKYKKIK